MTPAPGPGAVVIFKRSFVAAHSPSHDRLCLAVRAMLLRLTLTRHRSAPVPSTSLCDVRGQRGRRAAPPDIRQQTDRRTDGTLVIGYITIAYRHTRSLYPALRACAARGNHRNLVLFRTPFNFVRCRPYENNSVLYT